MRSVLIPGWCLPFVNLQPLFPSINILLIPHLSTKYPTKLQKPSRPIVPQTKANHGCGCFCQYLQVYLWEYLCIIHIHGCHHPRMQMLAGTGLASWKMAGTCRYLPSIAYNTKWYITLLCLVYMDFYLECFPILYLWELCHDHAMNDRLWLLKLTAPQVGDGTCLPFVH